MRDKGFTLIELLLVITLLGFIMAVALTRLDPGNAKVRGQAIKVSGFALDMVSVAQSYFEDYGRCPSVTDLVNAGYIPHAGVTYFELGGQGNLFMGISGGFDAGWGSSMKDCVLQIQLPDQGRSWNYKLCKRLVKDWYGRVTLSPGGGNPVIVTADNRETVCQGWAQDPTGRPFTFLVAVDGGR